MEIKVFGDKNSQSIRQSINQFSKFLSGDSGNIVHAAIMPDAHLGYSVPIGSVFAAQGLVFPCAVGYDIGCGMCAIKTTFKRSEIEENSDDIFDLIYDVVPTGTGKMNTINSKKIKSTLNQNLLTDNALDIFHSRKGWGNLGTLGSGNHFIEIGYDESNNIWVIIHSGSRGAGHGIASHYMKVASGTNKAKEGYYPLDVYSQDGVDYINDMNWSLSFALDNRLLMIENVVKCIQKFCTGESISGTLINRNHNHAEKKDGLWIHRKGATHAENGMMGVIPGNMRDGSFIVKGLGNPESLYSSSHGAGRLLSRSKAKDNIEFEKFQKDMENIKAKVTHSTIDESPDAYKNIYDVLEHQKELIQIKHIVRPLINVKG